MQPSAHSPDPIDIHVGGRVRERRRELKLSQSDLARSLGITFQQVQKYERGANRVSASKLHATAAVLQVGIDYFFPDAPPSLVDDFRFQALAAKLASFSPGDRQQVFTAVSGVVTALQEIAGVSAAESLQAKVCGRAG